jgi:putative transposase
VIEDLAVRNLVKNRGLARAISDASWSELREQLEYKCAWYGRELVMIDRFYPSSKTCSGCGHVVPRLPLNVREWTCAKCAAVHDRDGCVQFKSSAARNIEAAGLAVLACGAGVRPQRKAPGGQSAMKQESQRATAGSSFR